MFQGETAVNKKYFIMFSKKVAQFKLITIFDLWNRKQEGVKEKAQAESP